MQPGHSHGWLVWVCVWEMRPGHSHGWQADLCPGCSHGRCQAPPEPQSAGRAQGPRGHVEVQRQRQAQVAQRLAQVPKQKRGERGEKRGRRAVKAWGGEEEGGRSLPVVRTPAPLRGGLSTTMAPTVEISMLATGATAGCAREEARAAWPWQRREE
jgi:hypothetical protein